LKPRVVEVNNKGKINGACPGKNVWDDMLKSTITCYLDVSILHVREQNQMDMETLWAEMDGLFEYGKNPLCKRGFEDSVCWFLKGERFCLKNLFTKQGQRICPLGIEPPQWERLMKYLIDEKTILKALTMFNAQGNKKKPSKYGRGGKLVLRLQW